MGEWNGGGEHAFGLRTGFFVAAVSQRSDRRLPIGSLGLAAAVSLETACGSGQGMSALRFRSGEVGGPTK